MDCYYSVWNTKNRFREINMGFDGIYNLDYYFSLLEDGENYFANNKNNPDIYHLLSDELKNYFLIVKLHKYLRIIKV